jgi:uncharacterized protein (TIGR04255 family)
MATVRPLARPPITEALVDIQIAPDATITIDRLQPLRALSESYPKFDEKTAFQAEFRVENGKLLPPSAKSLGFEGIWLTTEDGGRIAQFRPNGFTLNNVGAYIGGDKLLDESLALWAHFADIVTPPSVTRIALRYLNSLQLPLRQGEDFERFLTTPPQLPPEAPQFFGEFLQRVVANHEYGATVAVTQQLMPNVPGAETVQLVIDVDTFLLRELDPSPSNLRPILATLRQIKNTTFFALLTEEAVKLYER